MHNIEFELSPKQFIKAIRRNNQRLLRAMPAQWLFGLLAATLAGGFAFLLIYSTENLHGSLASVIRPVWIATLVTVAAYAGYVLYYQYGLKQVLRRNRRWVGNKTRLSIDEAGLRTSSIYGESFTRWNAIQNIEQLDDLLLLNLDSLYFIPVPTDAFATPQDKEAFVSFAQAHLAQGTGSQAPLAVSTPTQEEQPAPQTTLIPPASTSKSRLRLFLSNVGLAFKLLFFMRVPEERIHVGWGQIPAFGLAMLVLHFAWSFLQNGMAGQFMWYSLPAALFHLPILMLAAIFIAYAVRRSDKILLLLQVFLMISLAFDLTGAALSGLQSFGSVNLMDFISDGPFFSLASFWLAVSCYVAAKRYALPTLPRRFLGMALALVVIAWPLGVVYRQFSLWEIPYVESEARPDLTSEDLFYSQQSMLERELAALQPERPGITDIFFIGMAGYGHQDVFMKEVDAVTRLFRERFDAEGHTIRLVNNNKTLASSPIASTTSLKAALDRASQVMNKEEDVLFLFLTSHGSESHQFALDLWPINFNPLDPTRLRKLLDESGIKHRVVVISACYSGGFINALKDDNTLVISASAPDKNSFGCGNHNDWTYFGEAYFNEALRSTHSFVEAFNIAKPKIAAREKKENFNPSNPQIAVGSAMQAKLSALEKQLAAGGVPASLAAALASIPEPEDDITRYVDIAFDQKSISQYRESCIAAMHARGPDAMVESDPNYFGGLRKTSTQWPRLVSAWTRFTESFCAKSNEPDLVRKLYAKSLRAHVPTEDLAPVIRFLNSPGGQRWLSREREADRQFYVEWAKVQNEIEAPLQKVYQEEQNKIFSELNGQKNPGAR